MFNGRIHVFQIGDKGETFEIMRINLGKRARDVSIFFECGDVHHHVKDLAQGRRWLVNEFKAFAAEAQVGQCAIEKSELLAGIIDLFARTVDEVFDEFLFGKSTLVSNLGFKVRQL
jgi:hypothetical protein